MEAITLTASDVPMMHGYGLNCNYCNKQCTQIIFRGISCKEDKGMHSNIVINDTIVEQVSQYNYLGSWITEDGKCEYDIKVKICICSTTPRR